MTCEHGKCNSFGLWHVQEAVPSSLTKHSCTTLSLRTPRWHLSLHATSNLCCLVPIGLTLCCWALVIFLSMYSVILYPNTIVGLFRYFAHPYMMNSTIPTSERHRTPRMTMLYDSAWLVIMMA